ncbi:MAG: hypothetical protein M1823_004332 [Watsoniomyces obsoletus]|nr:MAG: hypothetical protein M1823_004332 [Watsoniomyces obsoletus]
MHQLPRPSSKSAGPSSSGADEGRSRATNPRAMNPGSHSRTVSASEAPTDDALRPSPGQRMTGHSKEAMAKLNQIVQNYFIKAALIIVHSRMNCPPSYNKSTGAQRVNKWFNVEIDETDIFREDWRIWKNCDAEANRPPPMIIETYLDLSALTKSQTLVLMDEQGKQWNVDEVLNASPNSSLGRSAPPSRQSRVVLERWTVQLGAAPVEQPTDLNILLPVVYKKSIVLFRSLYTYSKFLPAWKFAKQSAKSRQLHRALQLHCRIVDPQSRDRPSPLDALTTSLSGGSSPVTEDFSFGATESPAGPFSVAVTYRTNCEFRVDDAEALLSSQFMGMDEPLFRPSLGGPGGHAHPGHHALTGREMGSLPSERRDALDAPDRSQAYGSLSSFHQVGPATASSPLSALRAARDLGPDSTSPSPPTRPPPNPRSTHSSKSSLRSAEGQLGMVRRPSVSFMPFKTPSLSASPSHGGPPPPSSPRNSIGRTPLVSALTQARNRTSMEAPSPSSLRGMPHPPEASVPSSGSGSPRPGSVSRYSSSFGHRRGRLSSGGISKPEDENNSSGRGSQASSQAQPGSGTLAEGGGGTGGSSGSIQTDDDNISDFLKLLETKKTLKSFEVAGGGSGIGSGGSGGGATSSQQEASSKRPATALLKFRKMRESHAALSDSLSSSMVLQRSSSTSSRQLSSVPPMVAGTSMSPSSSPGKPVSPHTPHTPAVPSRLSAHSVAVYGQQAPAQRDGNDDERGSHRRRMSRTQETTRQGQEETGSSRAGTHAIDIPRSPGPIPARDRRSSSVAQRQRALAIEDETGDLLPFGMRSASMGAAERQPLSLSALLGLQETSDVVAMSPPDGPGGAVGHVHRPRPSSRDQSEPMSRQSSSSSQPPRAMAVGLGHISSRHRARIPPNDRGVGHSHSGSHGEGSSSGGVVTGEGRPMSSARYSFSRGVGGGPGAGGTTVYDEDEPLLFAMSEIGGPLTRRSLEGGEREGGSAGGNGSGSGSGRGSRRGGMSPW